jgi:hypothetical protein
MAPSTLSTRAPYHGFHTLSTRAPYHGFRALSTHAPYHGSLTLSTRVSYHRSYHPKYLSRLWSHLQARSGSNRTLGLKSMTQVLKSTPVAQVDANGRYPSPLRWQKSMLTVATQAHSSGTSRH